MTKDVETLCQRLKLSAMLIRNGDWLADQSCAEDMANAADLLASLSRQLEEATWQRDAMQRRAEAAEADWHAAERIANDFLRAAASRPTQEP